MYNKSFQFIGLIIFIFACFFIFIVSFNVNAFENTYRAVKNESLEIDKNESKNITTKFLGYPYLSEDKNKFNNIKIYYNKYKGVMVKNYGNDKNTNNVNKSYKNVYKVIVRIGSQILNIYNNDQLINIMTYFMNRSILLIPMSIFVTCNKKSEFFSNKYGECRYYWTSISNNYLLNNSSYDKNKNTTENKTFKVSNNILNKSWSFYFDITKFIYGNRHENFKLYVKT